MTSDAVPARAAYEAWAATYDTQANATRDLDAAVLRAAGLPLNGQTIIEIGAGTGKNTAYLAAHASSVLSLDLSAAMLARARERVPGGHVRFVEHDITRPWPAADGQAGIVVGNLVLEHVAALHPVLAEAHRGPAAGRLAVPMRAPPLSPALRRPGPISGRGRIGADRGLPSCSVGLRDRGAGQRLRPRAPR